MFRQFPHSFKLTPSSQLPGKPSGNLIGLGITGYSELAGKYAGCTFDWGLYRIHTNETAIESTSRLRVAFPEFSHRAYPFGYDWLGREFAVDIDRTSDQGPLVLMLEPGTGEVLEIPFTFSSFHSDLDDLREPALAENFFKEWAADHQECLPLPSTTCIGYEIPLFLGGADTTDNLEMTDIDVYWELCTQLRDQVGG